ncbi:hypothetical protein SAY87_008206 [Trapa incisa]|uniref:Plastid division protein PDV1 n=1 Tax=Trapa incisa TaxID=236973 RepID=A0AAN7QG55_9MYRT|nr:hypothetical protein SAY87_008206 [Trapa incisa]
MKWDMEIDEVEAVLEKIWDLHDKLSDAIHSISRSHFLDTIKAVSKKSGDKQPSQLHQQQQQGGGEEEKRSSGYVFVKDCGVYSEALQEAKSLNSIRTALENLEDQLEFFHTVQIQQRAERDAALARLEQSRVILAMRLAEHNGKKYKVIEEALAFVGDVEDANRCIFPENLYGPSNSTDDDLVIQKGNTLMKYLISSFNFVKGSLGLDHMGRILGNAALVAVTMVAVLNFSQAKQREHVHKHHDDLYSRNTSKKPPKLPGQLDVLMARG